MKKYVIVSCLALTALLSGGASIAQSGKASEKKEKTKSGDSEEIIIRRKGDKDSKVVIELNGDDVKVNGKSVDEYEDENVSVHKRKSLRMGVTAPSRFRAIEDFGGAWSYNGGDLAPMVSIGTNKAFLGVTTEEEDGGAKIMSVSENSAAEKAGLKKGDVITKINDHDVSDPSDLTRAIGKFNPEDKVTVTYKRDGKENKASATLGKNKAVGYSYGFSTPGGAFAPTPDFDLKWNNENGRIYSIGGRPRLGIRAQDTEEGKGVKVLDVANESLAEKSGIKKGDIITEFDGKAVNSADDLAEAAQESREKTSVKVQVTRDGKSQTIEVKTPKKLKTANL